VIRKLHGEDGCLREIEFADGKRLARRALFFNTGQHPRSPLLMERLGCTFVRCSETGETSIPGVFVAGDVSRDVQLASSRQPRVPERHLPSTRCALKPTAAVAEPGRRDFVEKRHVHAEISWSFAEIAKHASAGAAGRHRGQAATGTTIVTFLMIFLVQNTQNRDARALHLKLDELLRSLHAARNGLIDLENCTDEEIEQIERQFRALKTREERQARNGIATPSA
jgi:hypothetical protein